MVRISSGRLRGRKIAASKKIFTSSGRDDLRPTSAKVREAVFDILQAEIDHAFFLDLYAGTGAVGLEALSRGADKVFFIENDPVRARALVACIHKMGLDDRAVVYQEKSGAFIQRAIKTGMKFDIIFADPPYASDEIDRLLPSVGQFNILKEEGCMLVEHPSKKDLPGHMQAIHRVKKYKYGDTTISLYRTEQ